MTKIKINKQIALTKPKQKPKVHKIEKRKILSKKNQVKKVNDSPKVVSSDDGGKDILASKTQIRNSVATLLTILEKQNQNKQKELIENEQPIILQIRAIKVPRCPRRLVRFVLPHSLLSETGDVCLFVPDLKRGRKIDHEATIHFYEDLLREKGITTIKGIIPMRQVKVEYDQYELKRRLLSQYDTFLVDAKISGHLTHLLGKTFAVKRKHLTPIKLDTDRLKQRIDEALKKAALRIHSQGDISTITIGHSLQKINEITENIEAVIRGLQHLYPGGWNNIRSLYVKSNESAAIPIYVTLKLNSTVETPKIKPTKPKKKKLVTGELSTYEDATVSVHPSGKIKLKVNKKRVQDENTNSEEVDDEPTEKSNKRHVDQPETKTLKKQKKSKEANNDSDDDLIIENAEKDYLLALSHTASLKKKTTKPKK